jgi:hypothetical protein
LLSAQNIIDVHKKEDSEVSFVTVLLPSNFNENIKIIKAKVRDNNKMLHFYLKTTKDCYEIKLDKKIQEVTYKKIDVSIKYQDI